MCTAQREPEKLRERKQKEKLREAKIQVIKDTTNSMLDAGVFISNAKLVQDKVVDNL